MFFEDSPTSLIILNVSPWAIVDSPFDFGFFESAWSLPPEGSPRPSPVLRSRSRSQPRRARSGADGTDPRGTVIRLKRSLHAVLRSGSIVILLLECNRDAVLDPDPAKTQRALRPRAGAGRGRLPAHPLP